jgi:hypothetical protein
MTGPDNRPVSAIRNLGPASEVAFARAGITTAGEVIALGTDAAYRRLLLSGSRPHFIGFYIIEMGLQGRPWNDCTPDEKKALRKRFDAVVKAVKVEMKASPDSGAPGARLREALDALGVVDAPDPER